MCAAAGSGARALRSARNEDNKPLVNSTDSHPLIQPIRLSPRPGVATVFALGGLTACVSLGIMLWLICSFAGWGDGSTGNAVGAPELTATLMVLPLVVYFAAGVTASLSTRRWMRILAVWVAHSMLLLLWALSVASSRDKVLSQLVVIYACIAILFCICWVKILMAYHPSGISHPCRPTLADNKRISMTTLRILAQDPDEEVRKYALEKLDRLQHKQ